MGIIVSDESHELSYAFYTFKYCEKLSALTVNGKAAGKSSVHVFKATKPDALT